nr:hypothetical protein [Nanoarchaeum sp.]
MVKYRTKLAMVGLAAATGLFFSTKHMVNSIDKSNYPEKYVESSPFVDIAENAERALETVTQKYNQAISERNTSQVSYSLPGLESFLSRTFDSISPAELDTLGQYKIELHKEVDYLNTLPAVRAYSANIKKVEDEGRRGSYVGMVGFGLSVGVFVGYLMYGINKRTSLSR